MIVSPRRSTTFSSVWKTSLRKPWVRSSRQICSIGFISGVYGGMFSNVIFEEYDEQFMYFLGVALALFALEMIIGERRSRRHLFEDR